MRNGLKLAGVSGVVAAAAVCMCVLDSAAQSAKDKYTVRVPGGLAFAEFRGYESWQTISISQNGERWR